MNTTYREALAWANQHRPHVEQRARSMLGSYRANLAHVWRLLLNTVL